MDEDETTEPILIGPAKLVLDLDMEHDRVHLKASLTDDQASVTVQVCRGTRDYAQLDQPQAGWDILREERLNRDQLTISIEIPRSDLVGPTGDETFYSQIRVIDDTDTAGDD